MSLQPIDIEVTATYIEEQSHVDKEQFVFAYNIRITNRGSEPARLVSRYWHIVDSANHEQEVQGKGVIGEQPRLEPGESYAYTSGVVIQSPPGTMEGYYMFEKDDGEEYMVKIPLFMLALPNTLH